MPSKIAHTSVWYNNTPTNEGTWTETLQKIVNIYRWSHKCIHSTSTSWVCLCPSPHQPISASPTPFLDSSSLDSMLLLATHLCQISTPHSNGYPSHWVFKPLTMAIKLNLNLGQHLIVWITCSYAPTTLTLHVKFSPPLGPVFCSYFRKVLPRLLLTLEITAWTSFFERPFLTPSSYYPLSYPHYLLGSVSTFISCINLFIC